MASLYIKDRDTAAAAARVAAKLGVTKTEAVRRALRQLETGQPPSHSAGSTIEWLRAYRAERPLPDRGAAAADKAFYDSLSDEDQVVDPWAR